MAQVTAVKEEEFTFPEGGIADFYMEDDQIAALEREEAEQAFGKNGVAQFSEVAARMASYGRGGDDSLAHVATGEIVIPRPLIANNPELKESIFSHLRELGVEDPEQFVVGSGANSINPETGLAEFGWLKKAFKKVTKAVKSAVKSVKKVVKKAAPIVLPMVGSAIFGPIYGAAFGSGIASLINGGSIKDAFKAALISGGTGALFSGASSAFAGKGFMSGVQNAANPANLSEGFKSIGNMVSKGDFSGVSFANMKGGPASEGGTAFQASGDMTGAATTGATPADQLAQDISLQTPAADASQGTVLLNDQGERFIQYSDGRIMPLETGTNQNIQLAQAQQTTVGSSAPAATTTTKGIPLAQQQALEAAAKPPSFLESVQAGNLKETVLGRPALSTQELLGKVYSPADIAGMTTASPEYLAAQKLAEQSGTGFMRSYGIPLTAGAAAAGYGLNKLMDNPEDDDGDQNIQDLAESQGPTGAQLVEQNPSKYLVEGSRGTQVTGAYGPYEVASIYNLPNYFRSAFPNYYAPIQRVADGGEIFPRRTGGIMPDEGIPGKDSVRAMLMPGEFVMTTDAVRGFGNGNMRQGINNMYSMMRNLEARGKAMA